MNLRILTVLLAFIFTNCLLTDEIGVQPPDSVGKAEIEEAVGMQAAMGWYMGCNMYLAGLTYPAGVTAAKDCKDASNFALYFISVKTMTPSGLDLEDAAYYKRSSLEECKRAAFMRALFITKLFLDTMTPKTNGVASRTANDSETITSTIMAGRQSGRSCKEALVRTGRVIEAGPLSL